MAAKTLATYISELSAVTSLGAGDKLPVLESSTVKYVDGANVGGAVAWGAITGTLSSQTDLNTALGTKQASDADLTAIAGLTPADDDFLQRKSGAWANRTAAQVKTDLGVPTYARYVALLAQTAPSTSTSGTLIVGETYTITTYVAGDDFANVADVQSGDINTTGCVFIATSDTPTDWSNGSTLDSAGNPRATVLENTLGGTVVWSYNGVGDYIGTLAGTFTANKTFMLAAVNGEASSAAAIIPYTIGVNSIGFFSLDQNNNPYELNGGCFFEIRVYP